jgi:hypothetical protein
MSIPADGIHAGACGCLPWDIGTLVVTTYFAVIATAIIIHIITIITLFTHHVRLIGSIPTVPSWVADRQLAPMHRTVKLWVNHTISTAITR